ncbi:hypothetical protein Tco_1370820 [Tanacetum coccineum]
MWAFVSYNNFAALMKQLILLIVFLLVVLRNQASTASYADDKWISNGSGNAYHEELKRFIKKHGRKMDLNDKETVGFDRIKVECYNFHRRCHFDRECRAPRNQENRNKDDLRRNALVDTSTTNALVVQDGIGSSSSDSEVKGLCQFPLLTWNYMPSRPDLSFAGLDDSVYKTKVSETETSISKTSKDIVEKPKTVRPSAPIIEEWDTNPVFHSKTKHIEIRHHFIRDSYEKRLIQVIKIHTDHNVADLLTKAFDVSSISDEFRVKTGGCKVNAARQNLFWNTAHSQTINDVKQIHATVDGKTVVISESSVRSDLHFNDEDEPFNDVYQTPAHTKKVFTNMKRKGKDFSGRVTPLFASMLAPPVVEGEGSGQPSEPQPSTSTAQPRIEEQILTSMLIPNVADEAVFKEWDDRVVRDTTTAASLDAA